MKLAEQRLSLSPRGWDRSRIKHNLSRFVGGGTPSKDKEEFWINGTIPWVSPKDMKRRLIDNAEDWITEEALSGSSTSIVPPGSVLMVVRSGILKHSLPVAINTVPVALNQDMKALGFRQTLLPPFFAYWIEGQAPNLLLEWAQIGATVDNINIEAMLNAWIALPTSKTQKAIADFLDRETARIDQLIEKKLRLVELLNERFNADRDRLFQAIGSNNFRPLRWLIKAICDGPFGSGLTSAHYSEAGVRVIRLQNIRDGGFDGSDAAYINEDHYASLGDHDAYAGDLLIAGLGDDRNKVGRACVFPGGLGLAMVKADCFRVRLDQNLSLHPFVAEFLCSGTSWPQIVALAKGVTRVRLNLELLRRLSVPVPPLTDQERAIAQLDIKRKRCGTLTEKANASIDRLREFRAALVTVAVTGQIDVTTWGTERQSDRRLDQIEEAMRA